MSDVDVSQAALLADIEAAAFDAPWSTEALRALLGDGLTRGFVAVRGEEAVGAALVRVVAGEGELLRIAVRPAARGHGVGRVLLEHVLSAIADACPHGVHLEVRASNVAARAMYRAVGFTETGRRRAYYQAPDEDAVVMQWRRSADDPLSM